MSSGLGRASIRSCLGYAIESFTIFEVEQAARGKLFRPLTAVPNVLEAHIIAGPCGIHCRMVATDNDDLRVVIDATLGVRRAPTRIALTEAIHYRLAPLPGLVARASEPRAGSGRRARPGGPRAA